MRLIERFHGSDGTETWTGVRYEIVRNDPAGSEEDGA